MWRDTGRPVKLVFLDARACLPLLVFVVYWSWTTFYIAATGVIFFSVISWAGLNHHLATRLAGERRRLARRAPLPEVSTKMLDIPSRARERRA